MRMFILGGIAATAPAVGIAALPAGAAHADASDGTIAVIGSRGDYSAVNYREDLANATEPGPRICRQRGEGYLDYGG